MSPECIHAVARSVSDSFHTRSIAHDVCGNPRRALFFKAKAVITYDRVLTHWSHSDTARHDLREGLGLWHDYSGRTQHA